MNRFRVHRRRPFAAAASMSALFLFFPLFLPASARAQEERPASRIPDPAANATGDVQTFLKEAYGLYDLPFKNGLHSFEADLRIRTSGDRAIARFVDTITVGYAWEEGNGEKITPKGAAGSLQKVIREMLQGIWMDMVAGGVFAAIEGKDAALEKDGDRVNLVLSLGGRPWGKIVFDPGTKLVLHAEWGRGETLLPVYALAKGKLRLKERKERGGKGKGRTRRRRAYGGFRNVNGFHLPTTLTVGEGRGATVFEVKYVTVNEKPATVQKADAKEVETLVKAFKGDYSKMTSEQKIEAMKKLEETEHEKAAEAVAKYGLKDKDLTVRAAAARTLGSMGCRKVVSTLGRTLKSNQKNPEVYMEIVKALGRIGDPKAIPYLTQDIWSTAVKMERGQDAAVARIEALGRIRSRKSVDSLIDLMYVGKPWRMGGNIRSALNASLRKLTGQNFRGRDGRFIHERDRWRRWWNDNKNRFKLEEDH